MKRTFIGIKVHPSKELLKLLNQYQRVLGDEGMKWTKPDNYHITLRFLGQTSDDQINAISHDLSQVAGKINSTKFRIKGINTFPNSNKPRVFFADIQDVSPLEELYKAIELLVEQHGFEPEARPYHPHLTLARVRHLHRNDKLKSLLERDKRHFFQDVEVSEIAFFESISGQGGVKYEALRKFKLQNA